MRECECVLVPADDRDDARAAHNLGVLPEKRGGIEGAEAAYRRADELSVRTLRGNADRSLTVERRLGILPNMRVCLAGLSARWSRVRGHRAIADPPTAAIGTA